MNEYGYQPPEENKENEGGLKGAWRKFGERVNEVFTGQTGETEANPESIIDGCMSLHDLFIALQKIGPIEGSLGKYSPERMSEIIDGVFSHKEKHTFNAIPSIYGLRDKVKEIYHNRFSARIAKITSFSSLIAFFNAYNGLQGNSELYTAEFLVNNIQTIMTDNSPSDVEQAFIDLTDIGNLKLKARELYDAQRQEKQVEKFTQEVLATRSFQELFAVLDRIGNITSGKNTFTPQDIKKAINSYRTYGNDQRLVFITSKYGIRQKVQALYILEQEDAYDQSRSGQDQQYNQYQGYGGQGYDGGQGYGNQNWGSQENAGQGAQQEQQSPIAQRIANARTLDELYFIIDQLPLFNNEPGKIVAARMRRARFNRNDIAEIVPEANGLQEKFYELFDLAEASGEGGAKPYVNESDNSDPEKKRQVIEEISKMKANDPSLTVKQIYRKLSRQKYHPDYHGDKMAEHFNILTAWYEKNSN